MYEGNKKAHWDDVYSNKTSDQVSWTQAVPQTSLDFIYGFLFSKSSSIIDIGDGDSNLVDFLIQ
ncbi:hypothetical protein [Mucilaginibacter phyllosphaerae]|uniref:Class I SAM-dependent methyltransferase n=1 Tax=Mucilaginibacter phyllosphaerae TaxID=1812349 RepID=A0ABR6IDZ3_9SPHI|nr:hypothetical protein [Mucilaginibacter phyllosphaerae]MBB3971202.1 hypothetical protein [Mucilaginibacter phyllosphaerae]